MMNPRALEWIAVGAMAVVMLFTGLGATCLFDEDEPKNAVCGQEMFARSDWIVPTFNGQLRTDKPILLYWCMLTSFHLFGVSEFGARFPSALAGFGTILLTFQIAKLLFDRRTGLIACSLLASSMMFMILARASTPDSLLIFFILASLTCFVTGVCQQNGKGTFSRFDGLVRESITTRPLPGLAWFGIYFAMGFAVLAKGPIGIVMPLAIIGSYLLFADNAILWPVEGSRLKRLARFLVQSISPKRLFAIAGTLRLGWGALIVACIALPWYIAVGIQTKGAWLAGFLGNHNVSRFMQPMEHHSGSPLYYLVAILVCFFPASVFLPVAIASSSKRAWIGNMSLSHRWLFCWIGCYVLFFSMAATKLPNYVTPCYPALAIMTGAWVSNMYQIAKSSDWRLWLGFSTFGVSGLAILVALSVIAKVLLDLEPSLAIPGLIAMIASAVCLLLLRSNHVQSSLITFVVGALLFNLSTMTYTLGRVSPLQDGPVLAKRIKSHSKTSGIDIDRVATHGMLPPSLVYYLGQNVSVVGSKEECATFFATGGDVLIMPRDLYDRQLDTLPPEIVVLSEERRFLRKKSTVVVLGRSIQVAEKPTESLPR